MPQLQVFVDADSILRLLCHYSDGALPVDAELKSAGVSARLGRWLGFLVASREWTDDDVRPLHIRYEGKRVMTFTPGGDEPAWQEGPS